MEVFVDRGAGIDVHKKSVTACVMWTAGQKVETTQRRFLTFHRELVALREWLAENRVTAVAMEATGEYWKSVYEVLEGHVQLVVANAQHVKNVPGRKTDPSDAAWLARLLRHGLVQSSYVPPKAIRDLRDLTRLRRKTIQMRARVESRVHKVLEGAGIKLASVVSDVFGVTGRAILGELSQFKTDPAALADLARGSLKDKREDLVLALEGSFEQHDAALLRHQLELHSDLSERRTAIERDLEELTKPHASLIARLDQMPGINRDAAIEILGEIGVDVSPWPDHRRFSAWAGLCPGNHESAGKRKKIGVRKGNTFLKSIMVQVATTAVRAKGTFYQAKYNRLRQRRGHKRAVVAIAHAMLIAIFHIIRDDQPFRELGPDLSPKKTKAAKAEALVRQLMRLGYVVELRANA